MFTGIIEAVGRVCAFHPPAAPRFLTLEAPGGLRDIVPGESIAVAGVCLSVRRSLPDGKIEFEVMPETLNKTTLGQKTTGDAVNLERSLSLGQRLGGHFVYGHVDGTGTVVSVDASLGYLVAIKPPAGLDRYLVAQGSVAVDGVSLTVARVADDLFTVALVQDTIERTTLGRLVPGDRVNLEADMIAKYAERLAAKV
ncbi:MAG: riboflavin synthase subunit alpha [Candidatus Magasanikbacteria bacterium GW2011_GWA2_56_11]|uniref:Riboflavin synthase n=1 Tax=Candidatus Magasanikbacteria bacterium GW2011_GWA2_56_11 TaxID=1619044 RepID=A0A0G1YEZ0_9BACT|nr:MAG: riboflavin synthase subunit alpha [Candidatus Magasanikbacteria bacterium GW2011_GWA2_56_11]